MTATGTPSLSLSVNPMAMLGRPFGEEFETLAAAGARRIGLSSHKLEQMGWTTGIRGAADTGLEVGYLVHGVFTAVDDDAGWRDEHRLLVATVEAAAEIGADLVYLCSGPSGGLPFEAAAERLARRLAPVVDRAAGLGVRLALENQLSVRTDCGFLFSLRDTLTVARAIGVGVCADLYCCWIEPGLARTLAEAGDDLVLVQVSDRDRQSLVQPDRRVPGDGNLPLDRLVDDVLAAGYTGLIDLELLGPEIEAEGPGAAVRRGLEWLGAALVRRGSTPR